MFDILDRKNMPSMDYGGISSAVLSDFREAEKEPYGVKNLRDRYHQDMMDAMKDRFESDIPYNDAYWEVRHKWQVLNRMIDGSFFG